jgi:hypothetical protein
MFKLSMINLLSRASMFLSFNLDINTSLQAVFTVVVHSYSLCEKQSRLGITDENVHRFMYIYFESNVIVFWSEYRFKKNAHTHTAFSNILIIFLVLH